jgi:hypothetical protein
MAKKKPKLTDDVPGLLTDLLITQLSVAGVQQQTIREILGCDINRVVRINKHIKAARKSAEARSKS